MASPDPPASVREEPADEVCEALSMDGLLDGTPYRALHVLGAGGMGIVIAAEHRALGKPVVVKLLHTRHAGDAHLMDRLRVEAQALARLSHENLVAVHDFSATPGGRPYYVMERLHGTSLREELAARGALPIVEALDLVRQALAGLGVAHTAGLVHRDVKLDNLFVCNTAAAPGARTLKVLDFGVAKVLHARGAWASGAAPAPTALPTREGFALGTPRFFSPEQACGAPVDARSDIYAVGVVLYTLIAGRGPFDHLRDLADVVRAHALERPVPPSRYAPRPVPPALDAAILRAMAKRPEERFQSAAALSEALAAIERDMIGAAAASGERGDTAEIPARSGDVASPSPEALRDGDALPGVPELSAAITLPVAPTSRPHAWLTTAPLSNAAPPAAPKPVPRFGPPPRLPIDPCSPRVHPEGHLNIKDPAPGHAVFRVDGLPRSREGVGELSQVWSWVVVALCAVVFGTVTAMAVFWTMGP